jgi:hypothetical protein
MDKFDGAESTRRVDPMLVSSFTSGLFSSHAEWILLFYQRPIWSFLGGQIPVALFPATPAYIPVQRAAMVAEGGGDAPLIQSQEGYSERFFSRCL